MRTAIGVETATAVLPLGRPQEALVEEAQGQGQDLHQDAKE